MAHYCKANTIQTLVLRSQNSRREAGRQMNTEECYGVRVNVSIRDGESCPVWTEGAVGTAQGSRRL